MTREEKLAEFVAWADKNITGDEKGQAQVFLDRLFQAFGQQGSFDAGGKAEFRIRKSVEDGGGISFADFVWKPVVLIEMKKRGVNLQTHISQAFNYWERLCPNRPRYVVLCNFDEFRIYDFDKQIDAPVDALMTRELPERYGPLRFLEPGVPKPAFGVDRVAVTREAADKLAACFNKLAKRGIERPLAQRFILQMLVALFAEDIDLLPKYFVAQILDDCTTPADAFDLIGGLFEAMNTRKSATGGRFKDVAYFNGGLFAQPARVELSDTELALLREAAAFNWSHVQPEIFGALFQDSLGAEERRAFGAHYTSPIDIMKIVRPTVIDPWREQIESAKTLKRLGELRERLHNFRVLDPACGSGNFLYIAYRELKRLETRLIERINEFPSRAEPEQGQLSFLSVQNFYGLDINSLAVEIAKVSMMIARKLAIDELHITERALPLDNLDANFIAADALVDANGKPVAWPKADVIIGNPPFTGAKFLKPQRGPEYVNAVRRAYPDVPGMADYCVYWLRKAHDHLPACTAADPVAGRAGLVGTQNIRNNQSRVGGLDYIVKTGTIIEAVENQPWSGEANVHVAIANWVKTQDTGLLPKNRRLWFKAQPPAGTAPRAVRDYELNYRDCDHINSALSDQVDVSAAKILTANKGFCYTGQYPRHEGFMLEDAEAKKMLAQAPNNREVVWPFLVGGEMLKDGVPSRWVIDFQTRSILEVQAYAAPFAHVHKVVLPYITGKAETERKKTGKDTGQDQNWLKTWWQHFRSRPELIGKVAKLSRYIVCSRVTKRPVFVFISPQIRPGDALSCFAFEDDYSFGIMQSHAHWLWFITKCSKFKSDFRYTPESVFDTFPWPQLPTAKQIEAVAEAGREVRRVRAEALKNIKGGLRALYRTLELPGANPLKDAHTTLAAAVLAAYGFSANKDLLAQLLALNLDVTKRTEAGNSVTAPGIPAGYTKSKDLVTEDCIQP
ncbi:MAG: DNA methyltransferase [Verrucomicrobiia bacterium]